MELQNSFLESLASAAWDKSETGNLEPSVLSCRIMAAYVPLRATISGSVPVQDFAQAAPRKLLKMVFCNRRNIICKEDNHEHNRRKRSKNPRSYGSEEFHG
jgi:hypothetical protein